MNTAKITEKSLADLVFTILATCGIRLPVENAPATKPITSIESIASFVLSNLNANSSCHYKLYI
jgi:hypothetical protein